MNKASKNTQTNVFSLKVAKQGRAFKKSIGLQILILPTLIYFIIFHYVPMYGIIIAFKDFSIKKGIMGSDWVGLKYFVKFVTNPYFFRLVKNTLLLGLYSVLWGFWPPILFALFLNEPMNKQYKKVVQTISYLPHFISTVAVCGIIYLILSPTNGLVNNLITALGGESIYFIVEPSYFRTIYIGSGIWQGLGFSAIIYLAALSSVDPQMYEAATIDGATRIQKMRHISIPSIMPTIIIMLILRIGRLFSADTQKVILLYQASTYEVSDVIGTYIYRRGLINQEYSYSAAVGLFSNVINAALVVTANAISRKVSDTSLW